VQTIRILADDLTGALDTAGCFASAARLLPVVFDSASAPPAQSWAASTGSRDLAENDAVARTAEFLPMFAGHDGIAFKKVDSLLRGHVAAELADQVRRSDFDTVVIAPAFPALDRVTRNGRQWAKLAGQNSHRIVGPDMVHDFARLGIDLKLGLPDAPHAGSSRVFMADAETDGDLQAVVDAGKRCGRVLWCGCAGLAEALAGEGASAAAPEAPRMLVICGTRHPVASLQVGHLGESERAACVALRPGDDSDAVARIVNERLLSGRWAALTADLPELSADAARHMLGGMIDELFPKLDQPDALIVMGGDTLAIGCGALGAKSLAVRGLLARGIPLSEFTDGAWAGTTVISKSGAFGAEDTLTRIMELTGAIGDGGRDAASPHGHLRQKATRH
jgi:uncharacterized protein YgbK (DUF1537 family)